MKRALLPPAIVAETTPLHHQDKPSQRKRAKLVSAAAAHGGGWQIFVTKVQNCPVMIFPPQDNPTDDRRFV